MRTESGEKGYQGAMTLPTPQIRSHTSLGIASNMYPLEFSIKYAAHATRVCHALL